MNTAPTMGVRETRRLVGEYTMTRADLVENTTKADSIAMGVWPIDIHPPKGQNGAHDMYVPVPYQISYKALVPVKIDNLLVAGRCASTDREAMGSMRLGATCGAMGQAAGVAAALGAQTGCTPRNLDYKTIQSELLHQGAIIE